LFFAAVAREQCSSVAVLIDLHAFAAGLPL
jgi:hypothetical protein